MKFLIIIGTLLITTAAFAKNSVTVCSGENLSQSFTFTVTNGQTATLSRNDDSPVQSFRITKMVISKKGDNELTKLTGEVNTSYVQYALESDGNEGYLMTTVGVSGARYLVAIGPMGKLIELGSSAYCK